MQQRSMTGCLVVAVLSLPRNLGHHPATAGTAPTLAAAPVMESNAGLNTRAAELAQVIGEKAAVVQELAAKEEQLRTALAALKTGDPVVLLTERDGTLGYGAFDLE